MVRLAPLAQRHAQLLQDQPGERGPFVCVEVRRHAEAAQVGAQVGDMADMHAVAGVRHQLLLIDV